MLLGNYSVLEKTAGHWTSGGAIGQGMHRSSFKKAGRWRNEYMGCFNAKSSFPSGYAPGSHLIMAQKRGGMAASTTIAGASTFTGGGALGLNAVAPLDGAGEINNAALALVLSAVAALVGAGSLTAAIAGRLDAAAALAGAGDVTGALGALAGAIAALAGAGALTGATKANGSLAAQITVTGDMLSTANVADAILDAINAIETGVTLREATRLILAAAAGKVSGAAGTTITIRNAVADDKDRIVATVDAQGNRTAITADLT